MKDILDLKHLDAPVELLDTEGAGYFKKGKYRILMIYEDGSFKEFWIKIKESYIIKIKGKAYIVVPKCIIKGKHSTLIYYFNNPNPIFLDFEHSKLTASKFYTQEQYNKLHEEQKMVLSQTYIDSNALQVGFSSKIIENLYKENVLTVKMMLLIMGGVIVVILIILQLTGTVDVLGFFSGAGK